MKSQVEQTPRQQSQQNSIQAEQKRAKFIMPFHVFRAQYKRLIPYEKKGHWSQKQKLKYAVFLQYYKRRFEIKAKRRFNNIFGVMAAFIKTRNHHQCRSHHQKMQKEKFKIDSIIMNTQSKYRPRVYNDLKKRYFEQIEELYNDEDDNFEKFKERIQKIQQKKAAERQIIQKNKRILRSSIPNWSGKQRNHKRFSKNKNQNKSQNYKISQELNGHKKEQSIKNMVIKQTSEVKQPILKCQFEQIQEQQMPALNQQRMVQQPEQIIVSPVLNQQQLQLSIQLQNLQNIRQNHLNASIFHYNEYIKHINQFYRIEQQMMTINPMYASFQPMQYTFFNQDKM